MITIRCGKKVVKFLRLVLSNKDVQRKYYSPHTNAIKDILSIGVNAVPPKKYSELEVDFKIGAKESIEIAELYSCENKENQPCVMMKLLKNTPMMLFPYLL